MIRYFDAIDIREKVTDIINKLGLNHIHIDRIACIRSKGSESRGVIARCHALPKIMQKCLNCDAFYVIEVLSEKFDKMSEREQIKTLIHELLHIPRAFGGGFRHHNIIRKKVEQEYKKFKFITGSILAIVV